MKRIAVVDADGILFAAALRGETLCDGQQMQLLSTDRIYALALEKLAVQAEAVGAEKVFVALSDRRNFRYDILPSYKGQRASSARPLALDALRARISEDCPHEVWLIPTLEADDVCGIAATTLRAAGNDPVIISPDKDLGQIPGKWLQWLATNSGTKGQRQVVEITEEAADDWHLTQTLAGDRVDNYMGCPKIGPVKAKKLLDEWNGRGYDRAKKWEGVVEAYAQAGLSAEDALVQARVARILRAGDWDRKAKKPILWNPPA